MPGSRMKLTAAVARPAAMHSGVTDLSAQGWTKHEAVAFIKVLKAENDHMSAAAADVPHLRMEVDALKSALRRRDAEIEELRKEMGALVRAALLRTPRTRCNDAKARKYPTEKYPFVITVAPPPTPE